MNSGYWIDPYLNDFGSYSQFLYHAININEFNTNSNSQSIMASSSSSMVPLYSEECENINSSSLAEVKNICMGEYNDDDYDCEKEDDSSDEITIESENIFENLESELGVEPINVPMTPFSLM